MVCVKGQKGSGPEESMCWMWKQIIFQLAYSPKRES